MKNLCAVLLAIITLGSTGPAWSYVINIIRDDSGNIIRTKWPAGAFPIRWRMNPVQGPNVTGTRTQAEVFAASFATWQGVSTAAITFSQGDPTDPTTRFGADGVNLMSSNTAADASFFPPGALAFAERRVILTGQIIETDIVFNPAELFTTNTTAVTDRIDMQSVMTHEIGHLLGLDHSPQISATMNPGVAEGYIYPRSLSTDDMIAASVLYPSASFAQRGKISGAVRTTANAAVYGAAVVAVDANGVPVASTVTDPSGNYIIEGLEAGSYNVYAEPLDAPVSITNIDSYSHPIVGVFRDVQANTSFTTRSR